MNSVVAALFFSSALARPGLLKRQSVGDSAPAILQYALTLEHLEATFYRQGIASLSAGAFAAAGFDATTYANLQKVAADEADHVTFLSSVLTSLGQTPTAECVYSFPYTDPASFIAVAAILEGVGVSAYLGAAKDISSPDYLTAAASILTVEARHSSYLRSKLNEVPFPAPYDTPLGYSEVYSLAAQFIVSCPSTNPPLPVKAFPRLTGPSTTTPGATITLGTPGSVLLPVNGTASDIPLFAAWMQPRGPLFAPVSRTAAGFVSVVPSGVLPGQSYVVLTNCGERVSDDTTLAGPAIVEVVLA
jgi:rubrerythrin